MLKEDGGIKALLGMVRSGSSDVVAQVARGLANFAKCESRGIIEGSWVVLFNSMQNHAVIFTHDEIWRTLLAGHRTGRSLLMDDGTLTWLIANSNTASTSTRRHIELALCHLAQNGNLLTML